MRERTNLVSNYKILAEAVNVLRDENLVWSSDFDSIREPLADWLANEMKFSLYAADKALAIAKAVVKDA